MNVCTPKEELLDARNDAETFWEAARTAAPHARRIQLLGNHDTRIDRLVANKAPELEAVLEALDVHALWRFDGVETSPSYRDEVVVEDLDRGNPVMLHHGYRSRLGDHAKFNQMSTAVGHTHRGGVVYHRLRDRVIWELNCGYVANPRSVAMSYTPQSLSDSIAGYGVIDEDGPRFISL